MFVYDVRCTCIERCSVWLLWEMKRDDFFSLFSNTQTHTHTPNISKIPNNQTMVTVIFCIYRSQYYFAIEMEFNGDTHRHIREIRYRKFNWNEHNRETFFIFFDLASLSLSHSHTIHMVFVLVNTFSLNSTMNDRRIRLHENKWKHFKDSLMKRKKFTIQSQKGLVTFGDLGWSWNSAI